MVKKAIFFESQHIGDSIVIEGILERIVFFDSIYQIDSIVFRYNKEKQLQKINTYRKGSFVYENIDFHENGIISRYSFFSYSGKIYERVYDNNGKLLSQSNDDIYYMYATPRPFINVGDTTLFFVFHINPPDCKVKVKLFQDGKQYDVYSNDKTIEYLKIASFTPTEKHEGEFMSTMFQLNIEDSNTLKFYTVMGEPMYFFVRKKMSF